MQSKSPTYVEKSPKPSPKVPSLDSTSLILATFFRTSVDFSRSLDLKISTIGNLISFFS